MTKGIILFLGESFRLGGQNNRNRGLNESYSEQIHASKSHINFINNLKNNKNSEIDLYINTYSTNFNNDLLDIYKNTEIKIYFNEGEPIGYHNLIHNSFKKLNIENYDFIFITRIDLFLKEDFINIFDPSWDKIYFPSICWTRDNGHKIDNYPRVNDTMLFIPKKYFNYINYIDYSDGSGHSQWKNFIEKAKLSIDDLDTMIKTYHDSDSAKDFNPLYYIVNRPEYATCDSKDELFDKYNFC